MNELLCVTLLFGVASTSIFADEPRGVATENDFAVLEAGTIRCAIGNNKSHVGEHGNHAAGYNGLFWLESKDQKVSPFVPTYAGINLEHYFDSRNQQGETFFEPRHSTMQLKRVDDQTVELFQPQTKEYGVESRTTFTVCEPYYIDFEFRCTPKREISDGGGFLGVFWASYINGPIDKSIYFLDSQSTLNRPVWRQFCTQAHDRDSTVLHKLDQTSLSFEDGVETLFSNTSPLRYSEPFFYGRFKNMVLIYVFKPNQNIRFSHSPSGGGSTAAGDDTNPAWDFQLIVPQVQVGQEYGLTGRVIYKKWEGRDDVLAEVRKYLGS
ncbi:MAG: hypothetical protein KDB27_33805 [Planctomycetales bacterium]|nr:hypothetical protein [Planctomycetales bacterium]